MGAAHSSGHLDHLNGEPLALVKTPSSQSNDGFLPEILEELASFLVGYDVLQLSHVCRAFRTTFSDSSVWDYRVPLLNARVSRPTAPSNSSWCEEQRLYFASRSFCFRGLAAFPTEREASKRFLTKNARRRLVERLCGDVCELPNSLLPSNGRVSFELLFSLCSGSSQGGILLGHQSHSCLASNEAPAHFQRIVHVDPEHNLYCSVLPSKPIVAHSLEPTRWYHLVLTYDGKRQCVYLNGRLVGSGVGAGNAHEKWHWTPYTQIGTGYIAASSLGKPSTGYVGWYPFEGVVDDFRVWYSVLDPEEVQRLAKHEPSSSKPVFTLSSDRLFRQEGVRRVKCSRPAEGQAIIHLPREPPTAKPA